MEFDNLDDLRVVLAAAETGGLAFPRAWVASLTIWRTVREKPEASRANVITKARAGSK